MFLLNFEYFIIFYLINLINKFEENRNMINNSEIIGIDKEFINNYNKSLLLNNKNKTNKL